MADGSTVSAVPADLIGYSQDAGVEDDRLTIVSQRLHGVLDHLRASHSDDVASGGVLTVPSIDDDLAKWTASLKPMDDRVGQVGRAFLIAGGESPDDLDPYSPEVVTSTTWQMDAILDQQSSGYRRDYDRFNQLIAAAQSRGLSGDEHQELLDIASRHTWWFAMVGDNGAGVQSEFGSLRDAQGAVFLMAQDTPNFDQRWFDITNKWSAANAPQVAGLQSQDTQVWLTGLSTMMGLHLHVGVQQTLNQVDNSDELAADISGNVHIASNVLSGVSMVRNMGAGTLKGQIQAGGDAASIEFVGTQQSAAGQLGEIAWGEATSGGAPGSVFMAPMTGVVDAATSAGDRLARDSAMDNISFGVETHKQGLQLGIAQQIVAHNGVTLPPDWDQLTGDQQQAYIGALATDPATSPLLYQDNQQAQRLHDMMVQMNQRMLDVAGVPAG